MNYEVLKIKTDKDPTGNKNWIQPYNLKLTLKPDPSIFKFRIRIGPKHPDPQPCSELCLVSGHTLCFTLHSTTHSSPRCQLTPHSQYTRTEAVQWYRIVQCTCTLINFLQIKIYGYGIKLNYEVLWLTIWKRIFWRHYKSWVKWSNWRTRYIFWSDVYCIIFAQSLPPPPNNIKAKSLFCRVKCLWIQGGRGC